MYLNQLYYVKLNGIEEGPYTLDQLRDKNIQGDTPTRLEGTTDWLTYAQISSIKVLEDTKTAGAQQTVAEDKSLWEYFVHCMKDKYATFNGRARRKEYWSFVLFNFLISVCVSALAHSFNSSGYNALSTIVGLALLVPSLAVGVRRLHDINKDGLWILLGLIPIIGWIILIIWYVKPVDIGQNQYGEDPKLGIQ